MTRPPSTRQEVTQLLGDWSSGDEGALEKLIPLVQPELHRLAHYYMSRERRSHAANDRASQRGLSTAYRQNAAAIAKPHTLHGRCRATNASHHGGSRACTACVETRRRGDKGYPGRGGFGHRRAG